MARTNVSLSESALADLQDVVRWYSEQGAPEVGRKIVTKIIRRIEILSDQPDIGRIIPEFDLPFLRELIEAPFRVVYRRDKGKARVVRIWRGERILDIRPDDRTRPGAD